jgi:hypothetical protein
MLQSTEVSEHSTFQILSNHIYHGTETFTTSHNRNLLQKLQINRPLTKSIFISKVPYILNSTCTEFFPPKEIIPNWQCIPSL